MDRLTRRLFDIVGASLGLLATAPVILLAMLVIWLQDRFSPIFAAERVGRWNRPFRIIKLRSMVVNAERAGIDSTSSDDVRITPAGRIIRKYKLDELSQMWNVLMGDMSLVGPRPNVKRETDLYTPFERRLLEVKPGITDFASIVFSDEGDILRERGDPDLAYNQLIRPRKSLLGLFYVDNRSLWVDVQLCFLTAVGMSSRAWALRGVQRLLVRLGASAELVRIAGRSDPLVPMAPPGSDSIVTSRSPAGSS